MRKALKLFYKYHHQNNGNYEEWYLNFLLKKCEEYIQNNKDDRSKSGHRKLALVEDLYAQSFVEHGRLKATEKYVKDVPSGFDKRNEKDESKYEKHDFQGNKVTDPAFNSTSTSLGTTKGYARGSSFNQPSIPYYCFRLYRTFKC